MWNSLGLIPPLLQSLLQTHMPWMLVIALILSSQINVIPAYVRVRDTVALANQIQNLPVSIPHYLEALYQQFKEKENDEQIKPIVQQFVNLVTVFDEEVEFDMKIVLVTSG